MNYAYDMRDEWFYPNHAANFILKSTKYIKRYMHQMSWRAVTDWHNTSLDDVEINDPVARWQLCPYELCNVKTIHYLQPKRQYNQYAYYKVITKDVLFLQSTVFWVIQQIPNKSETGIYSVLWRTKLGKVWSISRHFRHLLFLKIDHTKRNIGTGSGDMVFMFESFQWKAN